MRSGAVVSLNFALVTTCLIVGLTTTIRYYVPNNYHGLILSSMNLKLEIPETDVILKTGAGVDIKVKMPSTQLDLANAADMEAAILTDDNLDLIMSIVLPSLMVLLTLPITVTRLAVLGMDCIMVRRRTLTTGHDQSWGVRTGVSLVCGLMSGMITSVIILLATAAAVFKLAT